jgi:hypothetical protein
MLYQACNGLYKLFLICWQLVTSSANTSCWRLVGKLVTRCEIFTCVCQSIWEAPPPPPHTLQPIVLLLFTSSIFKDTLYFLLKYVLPPVLFTLTQVVLLLITSTFTRVQIQSNLGTTGLWASTKRVGCIIYWTLSYNKFTNLV